MLYYLAQTWTADRYWQAQHDAPARAASRARHSRPSPRAHRARGLPAVVTDPPVRPELVEGLPGGRAVDPQIPAIAGAVGEVLGLTQAEREATTEG